MRGLTALYILSPYQISDADITSSRVEDANPKIFFPPGVMQYIRTKSSSWAILVRFTGISLGKSSQDFGSWGSRFLSFLAYLSLFPIEDNEGRRSLPKPLVFFSTSATKSLNTYYLRLWWLITTTETYHNHLQSQSNPENFKNLKNFTHIHNILESMLV